MMRSESTVPSSQVLEAKSQATFAELFSFQALRTPDPVALTSVDEQLTFQQVRVPIDQLGRYLKDLGVSKA